jgi:hypothetical protein
MSTAKFDTLSNLAGSLSVPVGTVVQGSAKAWINFNGTGTPAIRAAFNVTSITDNGTGDYTLNFTTALPDANYAMAGALTRSGFPQTGTVGPRDGGVFNTTQLRIATHDDGGAAIDPPFVGVAVFR